MSTARSSGSAIATHSAASAIASRLAAPPTAHRVEDVVQRCTGHAGVVGGGDHLRLEDTENVRQPPAPSACRAGGPPVPTRSRGRSPPRATVRPSPAGRDHQPCVAIAPNASRRRRASRPLHVRFGDRFGGGREEDGGDVVVGHARSLSGIDELELRHHRHNEPETTTTGLLDAHRHLTFVETSLERISLLCRRP